MLVTTTAVLPVPCGHTDGAPAPGSLAPALRLAADLADQVAAADPASRITVTVSHLYAEHRIVADFLVHGDDARRLASLAACSRLFDVPPTVADPPPDPDSERVWVGGSAIRGSVRLSLHASLTDPAVIAEARRTYPAGTGGW